MELRCMNRSVLALVGIAAVITGCGPAGSRQAPAGSAVVASRESAEPGEVEMTLDQVPANVRQTIMQHVSADQIKELVLDNEEGGVYDVELLDGSEFSVSPDGTYLGNTDDAPGMKNAGGDDDDDNDEPGDDDDDAQ